MIDLIIKNAKVATASDIFTCDIGIDKEKIVFLEKDSSKEAKQVIDAKNQYVLPGGVDGHCHLDQRTKDGQKCLIILKVDQDQQLLEAQQL